MGGGHDGVATELARRLREDDHDVEVRDFLDALPWPLGPLLRAGYEFQIRRLAWSYELTYRFWCWLPILVGPLGAVLSWCVRRKIRRWVAAGDPDVVVSVYPLASQALGAMRKRGQLGVPAVTFLTDFAIHPVWVHRGVDLHLAVYPGGAADAHRQSKGPTRAAGPVVAPAFTAPMDRTAARAALGLDSDDRAVLIVAGSWGVGAVARTHRLLAASDTFVPVIVCGRNDRLRRRIERQGSARVVGWTDQMPSLMAACDALVENAGGLTSLEAMAAGLPVVSYLPIAGHGRANTQRMHDAGVATRAKSATDLLAALDALTRPGLVRARQQRAAYALQVGDAAVDIVSLAASARAAAPVRPVPVRRRLVGTIARVAAVAAAMVVVPVVADAGFSVATAYGVATAHAAPSAGAVAFVAVRLDANEITDPAIVARVRELHATVVVDESTVFESPQAVRALHDQSIDIANGGTGRRIGLPWRRVDDDVVRTRRALLQLAGVDTTIFVPDRRVDAMDVITSRRTHARVVTPNREVTAGSGLEHAVSHHVYLVDGIGRSSSDVVTTLDAASGALQSARLNGAPLSGLR
jgi:UDP-N-acetylglucosamine:LPS N-acetylglucosamine transferase